MFSRFFGKQTPSLPELVFKDPASAFEYACKFLDCSIEPGTAIPAIVGSQFNGDEGLPIVQTTSEGIQKATLTVASDDGGFLVVAFAPSRVGPVLKRGDFVAWSPISYIDAVSTSGMDPRFGWVGAILGTLKPQYDLSKGWALDQAFHPESN